MQEISIPWSAWYLDAHFQLSFPAQWEVKVFQGNDPPKLDFRGIKSVIKVPTSAKPLSEIAEGKKNAVIVVEDVSRPALMEEVLLAVLEELGDAGIIDEDIQIIFSLGAHRPLIKDDIIKKVGKEVWSRLAIFNHYPYDNLMHFGESSFGTPIYINKTYAQSDLKIGLSCIIPNFCAGFSGGAKIVVPGICGYKTIEANHRPVFTNLGSRVCEVQNNATRNDMEEIAGKVGLDFSINVIVNSKREITEIYAGDMIEAHRLAVAAMQRVHRFEIREKFDVVILNAYPKDTDLMQASNTFTAYLLSNNNFIYDDGAIIITTACSEGIGYHSLMSPGMSLFSYADEVPFVREVVGNKELCLFSPNLNSFSVSHHFSNKVKFFKNWTEAIDRLKQKYGDKCRIAILPYAPLQIPVCNFS
jgi:nickel-dependent lactate racemase